MDSIKQRHVLAELVFLGTYPNLSEVQTVD